MKISSDLKSAINRAQSALDAREKIKAAIDETIRLQPGAEARLQTAMEEFGSAQADAILSGAEPISSGSRATLADARDCADALSTREAGLRKKLIAQEAEIIEAAAGLAGPQNSFVEAAVAEFREKYLSAAEKFLEVVRSGMGLSEGLGYPLQGLNVQLSDPVSGQAIETLSRQYRRETGWQTAPNATVASARDGVNHVKGVADQLGP